MTKTNSCTDGTNSYGSDFKLSVIRMICKGLPGPSACVAPECSCFKEHGQPIFEELSKMFDQHHGPKEKLYREALEQIVETHSGFCENHINVSLHSYDLARFVEMALAQSDAAREGK